MDDYTIDLNTIPNGKQKPVELCEYLKKLREWREKSKKSQIWING